MDIYLKNTSSGLVPMTDDDYESKQKLKIGEVYKCSIKKARNYKFHQKYFALINCSWEYLREPQQQFFNNSKESYRKTCEIAAGHCDKVYNIRLKDWTDIPKSISFDKMDEFAFRELYNRIKDVILTTFLKHISYEEFEKNLINF